MRNGYSKRDRVLGVRVSDDELDAFASKANRSNLTVANWVRTLLRKAADLPLACDDYQPL